VRKVPLRHRAKTGKLYESAETLLPVLGLLGLLGFGKCDRAKPLSRDPGKIGHDVKKCNENAKKITTQEF